MADILNAIQQKQAKLQEQIADVQSNTRLTNSNSTTIHEQLRAALPQTDSQISSTATEHN